MVLPSCLKTNTSSGSTLTRDITPNRNVCRNLFGPVDHNELREEIEKDKREQMERNKRKYNFDFEKQEPLPGRYLWEKLNSATFDKSSTCSKSCEPLTTEEFPLDSKSNTTCSTSSTGKSQCYNVEVKIDGKEKMITDFFRSKKRKHEEESHEKLEVRQTGTPEKLQQLRRGEDKTEQI